MSDVEITANKNTSLTEFPFVTSGCALVRARLTTRGFDNRALRGRVAEVIADSLQKPADASVELRCARVRLCDRFPLYGPVQSRPRWSDPIP